MVYLRPVSISGQTETHGEFSRANAGLCPFSCCPWLYVTENGNVLPWDTVYDVIPRTGEDIHIVKPIHSQYTCICTWVCTCSSVDSLARRYGAQCVQMQPVRHSIVASIPPCHGGDRGSIPRVGGQSIFIVDLCTIEMLCGAEEACWAHNPKVPGSKPGRAKIF